jgi:hypothetical protein
MSPLICSSFTEELVIQVRTGTGCPTAVAPVASTPPKKANLRNGTGPHMDKF